jgi:hypothetical protein
MAKNPRNNDGSLLNEATILKAVELANAGASIIQVRSHERERVQELAQAVVNHPKSKRGFKHAHVWNASIAPIRLDNNRPLKREERFGNLDVQRAHLALTTSTTIF